MDTPVNATTSASEVCAAARCFGWQRRALPAIDPGAAHRALLDGGAALLESRSGHPGARYSYVAFSPLLEQRLYRDYLLIRGVKGTEPIQASEYRDAPLQRLLANLERVRAMRGPGTGTFSGGWVGWLSHEAGAQLIDAPVAEASAPARPSALLALFRLYRDVLVIDHRAGCSELVGGDWGEGAAAVAKRLAATAARLQSPAVERRGLAPEVVDAPSATLDRGDFGRAQAHLQTLIREGDCFQVNLTSSRAFPWRSAEPSVAELAELYERYAASNPGAWCGFFPDEKLSVLSASPELLVDWHGNMLTMRPIAGTRGRAVDVAQDAALAEELRNDPKEQAEHAMLVDLARNDLARASLAGSVCVTNLGGIERYRHVMHLVSEVTATARARLTLDELLRAVFPGGTVTGAPKRRAATRIAECERGPRGPYTGALGYAGVGGVSQWNLLIRTLTATPTHLVVHAGCGIVEASESESEAEELDAKAHAQVQAALGRASPAGAGTRCGHVEPGPAWRPGRAVGMGRNAQVLVVDFEDSFVFNLADYCRRLGAEVRVASAHSAPEPWWREVPTHLLLSPGPGEPADFPAWQTHLDEATRRGLPVLGVCLGHQALAQADGARVCRHPQTVHGRRSRIVRTAAAERDPLLQDWHGSCIGRYHSLVVGSPTPGMEVLATLEDGTLMAVRYRERPHWGLQFHPESLLTDDGLTLIDAFLGLAG